MSDPEGHDPTWASGYSDKMYSGSSTASTSTNQQRTNAIVNGSYYGSVSGQGSAARAGGSGLGNATSNQGSSCCGNSGQGSSNSGIGSGIRTGLLISFPGAYYGDQARQYYNSRSYGYAAAAEIAGMADAGLSLITLGQSTKLAAATRGSLMSLEGVTTRIHGNSLLTPKPTVGYALTDRINGDVLKYGETTNSMSRYSRSYLDSIGARMDILTEPMAKWAAKGWETFKIMEHEALNGMRPILNNGYH